MIRASAMLCVALASLPGTALAQPAYEALFFHDAARRAYEAGRFDDAYDGFAEVAHLVSSPATLYRLGLCAQLGHRPAIAFSHFQEYLASADEDAAMRRDAQQRSATLLRGLALVRVESEPPGARILVVGIDAGDWGRTPRTVALPPGEQTLRLVGDARHEAIERTVTAEVGALATVEGQLPARLGRLLVQTSVPAAIVARREHEEHPGTSGEEITLGIGVWSVSMTAEGYEPATVEVMVSEGEVSARSIALVRLPIPTGRLMVSAQGRTATVEIDGRARAETPARIDGLPVGAHQVTVLTEGYLPWRGEVEIRLGATRYLDITLLPAP